MSSSAFQHRHPYNTAESDFVGTWDIPRPQRLKYDARPDVYDLRQQLTKELERLNREDIPDDAKARIREFAGEIAAQGFSVPRQYFYMVRLRLVARMLGRRFLSPTREDIRDTLFRLTMAGYAPSTFCDIKAVIKRFYRWHLRERSASDDIVGWINIAKGRERRYPQAIISSDEFNRMLRACRTVRDRALISLLYDSGCRISEILTLRVRDVTFDEYGTTIVVTGKTGTRRVRLFGTSVTHLKRWISAKHPKDGGDSFVFNDGKGLNGGHGPMRYHQALQVVRRAARNAGIGRTVNPHLFRHTRATLLAQHIPEAPLEIQMGWVHGSSMTRVYVHISEADMDRIILGAYGISVKEGRQTLEIPVARCIGCGEFNPLKAKYCWKCDRVLRFKCL
jgi:integrase/recombinase XerD